ncbi:MAG: sugar phosphate nucleotidyltransferase [Opitutaceae bacterium]|nr:sugar phosphate nucleotidyltransferase [Opitutaceae bacterium]
MSERFVVIMAGGRGERFWPQSRLHQPKHLLPIVGGKPMLAQTIDRLGTLVPKENVLVITTQTQAPAVRAICPELPPANVIAEPVGRDTAAATGLALLLVKRRNPKAAFAMLPADHVIHDVAEFSRVLTTAFMAAENGEILVTLGIKPTEPATGYGYIQQAGVWGKIDGRSVFTVKRFVEKPSINLAQDYLASGDYLWNAGMFIWRVPVVEAAFKLHVPELFAGLQAIETALAAGEDLGLALWRLYPKLTKRSIDYALMEKAGNVVVVPATFDWDDVGAWPGISRHFPSDTAGNIARGPTVIEGGAKNIVQSTEGHLVALVGVDDLIVVHTPDATLVCARDKAQEIKKLLQRLEKDPATKRYL